MGSQTKAGFSSTARLGLSLVHARGVGWMIGLAVAGVEYAASAAGARTPEEARAAFRLADPRLTIELVASEPQVSSPVAMSWDLQGRLFVAEMNDYPVGTGGDASGCWRIAMGMPDSRHPGFSRREWRFPIPSSHGTTEC